MSTSLAARAGASVPPRVLLVGEAVTLSHVVRPDVFARGLHQSGYQVALACDPRFDALFEPRPFPVLPLRSALPSGDPAAARSLARPLFDLQTLQRYLAEDERLIRAVLPDVIVGDMRHSLPLAASLHGIPCITLIDSQFSPFAGMPMEVPAPAFLPPLGERLGAALYQAIEPVGHFLHALPMNQLMQANGRKGDFRTVQEAWTAGDFVVHPDFPGFVQIDGASPTHRQIGPVRWSARAGLPLWWDSLPPDRPVVFLNISRSSPADLQRVALRALGRCPVTVIAIADPRVVGEAAAPNAFLADALPGEIAAARASLTICNGGNTAVQQSLAVGTPVIALPSYPEQLMFSRRLDAHGAGLMLGPGEQSEEAIAEAVTRLLANVAYAIAARRFAEAAEQLDTQALFNAVIGEALAAAKQPGVGAG